MTVLRGQSSGEICIQHTNIIHLRINNVKFYSQNRLSVDIYCIIGVCLWSRKKGLTPGWVIPKTIKKKRYLMPLCLTLSIIRYSSRVSGVIQGIATPAIPLHLSVVVIKKGAFRSPSTTVGQLLTSEWKRV